MTKVPENTGQNAALPSDALEPQAELAVLRARVAELEAARDVEPEVFSAERAFSSLGSLLDSSDEAFACFSSAGCVTSWNTAAERLYGYSRHEAVGMSLSRLLGASQRRDAELLLEAIREARPVEPFETALLRRDGGTANLFVALSPIWGGGQEAVGAVALLRDIGTRKDSQRVLREIDQRYKNLLSSVIDYVFTVRVENGTVVETIHSPACETVTGHTAAEFAADPMLWYSTVEEADRVRVMDHAVRVLSGENVPPIEHRIRHKDGSVRWVRKQVVAYHDESGRVHAYDGLVHDITEQKLAEDALLASERRFRAIFDQASQMMAQLTPDGRVLQLNGAALRYLLAMGEDALQVMGKPFWDTPWWAHQPGVQARLREAIDAAARGEPVMFEARHPGTNGKELLVEFALKPVRGYHDAVTMLLAESRDITDRREAENALRLAQFSLDNASVSVFWVDAPGRIIRANKEACQMLGYEPEQLAQMTVGDIHPGFSAQRWRQAWEHGKAHGGMAFEWQAKRSTGELIPVEMTVRYLKYGDDEFCFTFMQDISARVQARNALEVSEKRLKLALEASNDGLYDWDVVHDWAYLSPRFCTMLGYQPTELVPRYRAWGRLVHPDDREIQRRALREIFSSDQAGFDVEYRMQAKDGSVLWIQNRGKVVQWDEEGKPVRVVGTHTDITERRMAEMSRLRLATAFDQVSEAVVVMDVHGDIQYLNPGFVHTTGYAGEELACEHFLSVTGCMDAEAVTKLLRVIAHGDRWSGRLSGSRKDGSPFEVDASISPVRDASGNVTSYVYVMQDVTSEVNLERQVRQMQKLEAIGTLAGGIAHDFNNALTGILGYADIMRVKMPKDSPFLHDLDMILTSGRRARDLVRQILAFSRGEEHERVPVELSLLVREVVRLLRATLPSTIEVRVSVKAGDAWTVADATQVHQVILNLCTNAYHAMRDGGGVLELTLDRVRIDDVVELMRSGLQGGEYVRLSVRDTGKGMDAATLERIFEPFFTTKPVGEGTGLGLSIVHGIVKSHGGTVTAYSEVGRGSLFHVYLPSQSPKQEEEPPARTEDLSGTERILVVDDEPMIATLAKAGLEQLGYQVTTCTAALDALEVLRTQPDAFDLVLTDFTMPHMTGVEWTRHAMRIRRDLPVILMTGMLGSEAVPKTPRESGIVETIGKPFTSQDLAAAVRRVMQGAASRPPRPVEETPAPAARPAGTNRLLLAEDDSVCRRMFATILRAVGYVVSEAEDGRAAWELFQAHQLEQTEGGEPFSLLVTDLYMPNMDGLELTTKIHEADPDFPMVMLTGQGDKETVKQAIRSGVREFLEKTVDSENLIGCVDRLVVRYEDALAARREARRREETAAAVRRAQMSLSAYEDLTLFQSHYEPLSDAGGDVFHPFALPDGRRLFMLADVAGHSVESSYAVASFLGMVPALRRFFDSPRKLAERLNDGVHGGQFSDTLVCCLIGLWDPRTGRLHLINMGMPYGLLLRRDGAVERLEINGAPLGAFAELAADERMVVLRQGDRVLLGSDGFLDHVNDHVVDAWRALRTRPLVDAVHKICAVAREVPVRLEDDLLAVAFEQEALSQGADEMALDLDTFAEGIDGACEWLGDWMEEVAAIAPSRRFEVLLAVREALTNAWVHGNEDRPKAHVGLFARHLPQAEQIEIMITDEGPGFDPVHCHEPDDPLQEGGRGVPLMQRISASLEVIPGQVRMLFGLASSTPE